MNRLTTKIIVNFVAPINLENLNIFHLGTNKKYFNHAKTNYSLANTTIPAIEQAIIALTNFSNRTENQIYLNICGRTLKWIDENSKQTEINLRNFAKSRYVNLVATPFFGTSILKLPQIELTHQLKTYHEIAKKIYKRTPVIALSDSNNLNESIEQTLKQNKLKQILFVPHQVQGIYNINKQKIIFLTESFFTNKTEKQIEHDLNNLNKLLPNYTDANTINCPLQKHVQEELTKTYHPLKKLNDESILTDWRLLSAHNHLSASEDYESYISSMNTLNDLAYKVKNIDLLNAGQELIEPLLLENPSQLLENLSMLNVQECDEK